MKKTTLMLVTAAALVSSSAFAATTSSTGIYAGSNIGYDNISAGNAASQTTSTDGFGYNFHGGYMFNQYFGAELGYTRYADVDLVRGGHYSLDAVSAAAKGVYYFQPQWSTYGELGLARLTGSGDGATDHKTGAYLGAGFGYDVVQNVTLNAGWSYGHGGNTDSDDVGNANFFYAGADYHF